MFQQVYRSASGNCHGIHDEWCYQSGIRCKDKGKKEDHVEQDFFEADRGTEQEADR